MAEVVITAAGKAAAERYHKKLDLIKSGATANPFESKEEQQARIEQVRKDVAFMVSYYLPHYATAESADFQIRLARRVVKNPTCRELVRWGRGLAKSVWCDLIIPLWLYMRGETNFIVVVGNTYDKAVILLSDLQAELEANPRIIHDFGEQKFIGSWADGDFQTKDGRLFGMALGMGQSPRGLRKKAVRPTLIIADDLEDKDTVKNPKRQDEVVKWIERDLIPTMDGPMRRYLHPNNDPFPRSIQNQLQKLHPGWHVDEVKAYDKQTYKPAWPQKYSAEYYKNLESDDDIGILAAHAEFLNEPHIEGKIFTHDLIQWGKPPRIDHFKLIVGHWDVAYSGNNDYNAVKVWGLHGINFWHLKSFCRQCKMEDAIRFMYFYESTLPPSVRVIWRVEAQFWGDPVQQAIERVRREKGKWLGISVVERPKTKKYDRMISMHPYFQNNRVYYSDHEYADNDMQTGIAQLKGIEPGYSGHDDGPDADQQAIEFLAQHVVYRDDTQGCGIEFALPRRNNRM